MKILALRVFGIGVALATAFVLWGLLHGRIPFAWEYLVWLVRNRYCLMLIALPATLTLAGVAGPVRSTVRGLLILRDGDAFQRDLFNITCLSLATVGVGLSGMRIVELHGDARLGSPGALLDQVNIQPNLRSQQDERGWGPLKLSAWILFGLFFPVGCAVISRGEGIPTDRSWKSSALTLVGGAALASMVTLVLLSLIQRWVLGTASLACGILPFEPQWGGEGPPSFLKHGVDWLLIGPDTGLAWLMKGPGYTDEAGRLLRGHSNLALLSLVSMIVYLSWYTRSSFYSNWSSYLWPASFYILMLIFFVGMQMAGLAFWIDRFGVPPTVLMIAWSALMYWIGQADHFFEVYQPDSGVRDRPAKQLKLEEAYKQKIERLSPESSRNASPISGTNSDRKLESGAALAALVGREKADDAHVIPDSRLKLNDVFQDWQFPMGTDQKRTLVVVTASGGGIQAAAWAAQVLTELDREYEGFSESIGLISSVSGGSVGTLFYLSHRGPRVNKADSLGMEMSDAVRKRIVDEAEASSIEAVSWGVAFPDLVRSVFPPLAARVHDRGWALESAWWNRMGRDFQDRSLMQEIRLQDLTPAIQSGLMPAVVFNATTVETGQRLLISPVQMNLPNPAIAERDQESVARPIDFLDFYGPSPELKPNPRLSTAARLSASFSYVSPVARPFPEDQAKIKKAMQDKTMTARGGLHFCDGGYADNSGIVTAVRAVQDLLDYYDTNVNKTSLEFSPPFDRVLILRIEPFPFDQAKLARENTGFSSAIFGPATAIQATRVSTQAERGGLEVRLLRERQLHKKLAQESNFDVESVTFRFQHEDSNGKQQKPPLSWTLAASEKEKIRNVWTNVKELETPEASDSQAPGNLGQFFQKR